MSFAIGLIIALGCMLGGFAAMGGHLVVIWQPWEFVIIGGAALGTFVIANSPATIKDTGAAIVEALLGRAPHEKEHLELLALLHALMKELRQKTKAEVEAHIERPGESAIFLSSPTVLGRPTLATFICDYIRLLIMGKAKSYEIEALMDEELQTLAHDFMKPYHALTSVADAMPALGIVAAVLGVIKAMGALDQSPEILGGLIGAALVGTFVGIFVSYGIISPLSAKIKITREKQLRLRSDRRLAVLAGILLAIAAVLLVLWSMPQATPSKSVLYSNLDRAESAKITQALRDSGLAYELSADGTSIQVGSAESARAKGLLAERGFPSEPTYGYEIMDRLGATGLTTFVQDMTKVRIVEGELARTIRQIRGVNSARVHLVFGMDGSFRKAKQEASASVIINAESDGKQIPALAIRRLVAGAVPGLLPERVTIVSNTGMLIGGGDNDDAGSMRLLTLERAAAQDMRDNVVRTLGPIFGAGNILVNATVRLNADKRQISETTFNPDSRVDRSVRAIRENQTSQNSSSQASASVDRNQPDSRSASSSPRQSNEDNAKRDEITNYEISSKSIATQSDGYEITYATLSVAINDIGDRGIAKTEVGGVRVPDKQELEDLITSAAGLKRSKEHDLKVSFVKFDEERNGALERVSLIEELLVCHGGDTVRGLLWLIAVGFVAKVVVRPVALSLFKPVDPASSAPGLTLLNGDVQNVPPPPSALTHESSPENDRVSQVESFQKRFADELEQLVIKDEDRSVRVLRLWLKG